MPCDGIYEALIILARESIASHNYAREWRARSLYFVWQIVARGANVTGTWNCGSHACANGLKQRSNFLYYPNSIRLQNSVLRKKWRVIS